MKRQVTAEEVYQYFLKFLKEGNFPSVAFAARRFSVREDTIRVKVRILLNEKRLVKYKLKYYLPDDPRLEKKDAPKGKRILSVESLEKMSRAGMAGAEALKRQAFETGKKRFVVGSNKDEEALQARIEAIVNKAEGQGTCYRPNYVSVHGMKRG